MTCKSIYTSFLIHYSQAYMVWSDPCKIFVAPTFLTVLMAAYSLVHPLPLLFLTAAIRRAFQTC